MPILYTPINSIEILRQKRLTLVVLLFERNKNKHENFAYINVNLKDFKPTESPSPTIPGVPSWDYELLIHDRPVIGFNRTLGKFQAVIRVRIINAPQAVLNLPGSLAF